MPKRLPLPPRRVLAAAVLVVAGAWLAVPVLTREDVRAGSEELAGPATPLEIMRTPRSYQMDYRIEDLARETVVSTDRLWVRRPFDGRLESWSGPPPGDKLLSVRVSNFGMFANKPTGSQGSILQATPALAASDLRADVALLQARDSKRVLARERRVVAGRECQVFRTGGPVNAGDLKAYDPKAAEWSDVCVDEAGLVLEEVWVKDGDMLRRRVATTVTEDPELSDEVFAMPSGRSIGPREGGGSVRRLVPTSRPPGGSFWELESPPAGFAFHGRFAVVPAGAPATDPQSRSRQVAGISDVFANGPDVVVVDVGGSVGFMQVLTPVPKAEFVDAGPVGKGQVIPSLRLTELRILREKGKYVRVWGTVEPARLIEIARGLREVPGGELTCLSDAGVAEPCVPPRPSPSQRP